VKQMKKGLVIGLVLVIAAVAVIAGIDLTPTSALAGPKPGG
jgi:hypothetical protein